jgi:hypothetical protein
MALSSITMAIIRYIEGNRLLTLSYEYVDEGTKRQTPPLFRTYVIHVQVPTANGMMER